MTQEMAQAPLRMLLLSSPNQVVYKWHHPTWNESQVTSLVLLDRDWALKTGSWLPRTSVYNLSHAFPDGNLLNWKYEGLNMGPSELQLFIKVIIFILMGFIVW